MDGRKGRKNIGIVCPEDTACLLAVDAILNPALVLAARQLSSFQKNGMVLPGIEEPSDLFHELFVRYGEGRRTYQWEHWTADKTHDPWTHYVFTRLVGRLSFGAMRSIVNEIYERARESPIASSGVDEDAESGEADEEYQEKPEKMLGDKPSLLEEGVQECAAAGAFNPYGSAALSVYRTLYKSTSPGTDAAIATKQGVSQDFVAMIRDRGRLIALLDKHAPALMNEVRDLFKPRLDKKE